MTPDFRLFLLTQVRFRKGKAICCHSFVIREQPNCCFRSASDPALISLKTPQWLFCLNRSAPLAGSHSQRGFTKCTWHNSPAALCAVIWAVCGFAQLCLRGPLHSESRSAISEMTMSNWGFSGATSGRTAERDRSLKACTLAFCLFTSNDAGMIVFIYRK